MKANIFFYFIIVVGIIFSNYSHANCQELLQEIMKQKTGHFSSSIYGDSSDLFYKAKRQELVQELSILGTMEEMIESKFETKDLKLRKFIESRILETRKLKAIETMREAMHDTSLIVEWAEGLHRDIAVEIILSDSHRYISQYSISKKIPREFALKVLISRAKVGGFRGNSSLIIKINSVLSDFDFLSILKSGRLLLDTAFKELDHGELIHLLQIDYMIYAIKRNHQDPNVVSEIYKWIGENFKIDFENFGEFRALEDVWANLFDGFSLDMTSPEVLNPILERYFDFK